MKTWVIPKGRAMALHLSEEYREGKLANTDINPYDFWDEYEKSYAWDMGWQWRKNNTNAL